jgi:hypothetical protein
MPLTPLFPLRRSNPILNILVIYNLFGLVVYKRRSVQLEGAEIVDPKAVTDRYFAAIKARSLDDLMALYADDATFVLPNGKESKGIAAIRQLHQYVFQAAAPVPTPRAWVIGNASAAVEIEAQMPDGTRRQTINVYYLNDRGQIERLSVYMRTS